MTTSVPAAAASAALPNLLAIPPVEYALPFPFACPSSRSVTAGRTPTRRRRPPPASARNPFTVVSSTSACAPASIAVRDASASLSPNLISSVATTSFSFTMGTTPFSSSFPKLRSAFKYRSLDRTSACVSNTCAMVRFLRPKISSQAAISRDCPTAAAI